MNTTRLNTRSSCKCRNRLARRVVRNLPCHGSRSTNDHEKITSRSASGLSTRTRMMPVAVVSWNSSGMSYSAKNQYSTLPLHRSPPECILTTNIPLLAAVPTKKSATVKFMDNVDHCTHIVNVSAFHQKYPRLLLVYITIVSFFRRSLAWCSLSIFFRHNLFPIWVTFSVRFSKPVFVDHYRRQYVSTGILQTAWRCLQGLLGSS